MGNLRDLKAFVRYDGSGRVVAGSLIFRKKKPTVGNFQQIQAFKCCNMDQVQITVAIQSSFPISSVDIVLFGQTGDNLYMFDYTAASAADIYELAAVLNAHSSQFGWFSVDSAGVALLLQPNSATAAFFVASGATSIGAAAFND
jgi:hypothetical protein